MTTPQAIRQLNETRALAALFRAGGMSRAELARSLGLTRSTTGSLVQSLLDAGLVRERPEEEAAARVGRPGILVEIDGDGAFFIGADIGVDRITALAVDLAGMVRHAVERDFRGAGCDPAAAIELTARLIGEALAALPAGGRVEGISVAIPGFLAADQRTYHATILGWHGVEVASLLRRQLGIDRPVLLENDANAFAVAETYRQAGREPADILVVLIENGVGGGIIAGGRLYHGRQRGAGEIGHIRIGEEGYVFDPRRPGRFETFVGKDALLARWRYHGGTPATLAGLLAALEAGDAAAQRTAADWGRWLARGLAALISTLEPQKVVLGGSVSAVFPFVAEAVAREVEASLVEGYPVPAIETSTVRTAGPALGAAYLLHQAMLSMDAQFQV
ncbi:ROK family transcriptional regulator [Labrys wisconsinensis]|uniref:NBD/HSP70 family sugar kinase n=1 Tax=Labrys wisconsinensis TaxID=425677 RepID=A0ABU0JKE3_9HYPH|nr:ROK family transcriptional regulator [Labrys wisconsinensis]MDQ0474759.1 putative NBD/HSP70 family sugar kinase [Labrys wisconsinensis]